MSNYVNCPACKYWKPIYRINKLCGYCNNSGLVQDSKEILCNKCGGTMCHLNETHPHGLHKAAVSGGYNSYHLFDSTTYTFNICEKCLRELFISFVIKPNINNSEYSDQKNYEYRVWKDTGGYLEAYKNKLCNVRKECPNKANYTVLYVSQYYSDLCCCEEHSDVFKNPNYNLVKFIPYTLKAFL